MDRWRRTEERIARDLGGTAQAGSGNTANRRGDIRVHGRLRVQEKTTSGRSFSLRSQDWEEVREQALLAGEEPVMVIRFLEGDRWLAVLDYDHLLALLEEEDG